MECVCIALFGGPKHLQGPFIAFTFCPTHALKKSACRRRGCMALSGGPKHVYSYASIFLRFSLNAGEKWLLWCCCRYGQSLLPRGRHPFQTYDDASYSNSLDSHSKTPQAQWTETTSRRTWKSRMGRDHWENDTSATVEVSNLSILLLLVGRLIPLWLQH